MKHRPTLVAAAAAAAVALLSLSTGAAAQDAAALRAQHDKLKDELAASAFQRPLVLQSNAKSNAPQGDVYAVVDKPFGTVKAALQKPSSWCDVLILQHNIKRCVPAGNALQVAIGRKHDQPIEDAFKVDFRYALRAASDEHLAVQLSADAGPVGTSNYRLGFQAVPLDARRTFVHMSYSYQTGVAARMATDAYLATSGRAKVGFSKSPEGGLVGGVQGVAERNTMRYYLGIEALLDSLAAPENQRVEKRLNDWFAATERYPQQLREMSKDEYMTMKRKEVQAMQTAGVRKEAPL